MNCKFCGKQIPSDSRFCNYCGGEQTDGTVDSISAGEEGEVEIMPTPPDNLWQPPPPPRTEWIEQPEQPKQRQGATSRRQKATAFWARRPIFSNLVVFICAVTVFFVALFSPIKMPWYDVYGFGTPQDEFTIVRSEQTIFQIVESIPYYLGLPYDEEELGKERNEAVTDAQKEYYEWLKNHESASDDQKLQKQYDFIAEHLSDLNCFKYMAVTAKTTEVESAQVMIWMSLLMAVVVVILTAVIAINSLVTAIKAIVGMCRRRLNARQFSYLQKMFALSTAGVSLTMCAPLLCAGGGMLAVALITTVAYFICAAVKAAVADGRSVGYVINNSIVTLITTVVFILLCADPMAIGNIEGTTTVVSPIGFGLYTRMAAMFVDDGVALPNNISILFVQYFLLACVVVPLVAKALLRSLRSIIDLEYGKLSRSLIAAAVLLSIAIVLGLLSKPIYDILNEHFGDGHCFDMLCKMRPIVWVAAALSLSTGIFYKVTSRRRY